MAVMGDHDHRHAFLIQCGKQIHNLGAGLGIQCSGGLVRQQDLWLVYHGPGNGNSLLLTSGQLVRNEIYSVRKPYFIEGRRRPFQPFSFPTPA